MGGGCLLADPRDAHTRPDDADMQVDGAFPGAGGEAERDERRVGATARDDPQGDRGRIRQRRAGKLPASVMVSSACAVPPRRRMTRRGRNVVSWPAGLPSRCPRRPDGGHPGVAEQVAGPAGHVGELQRVGDGARRGAARHADPDVRAGSACSVAPGAGRLAGRAASRRLQRGRAAARGRSAWSWQLSPRATAARRAARSDSGIDPPWSVRPAGLSPARTQPVRARLAARRSQLDICRLYM